MTRNALIVRGGWDGHDPVRTTDLFVPFLHDNDFAVTISDTLEVYTDAPLLSSTDLIVQCWTMGTITEQQVQGLRSAVAAGTGLAGWHGGIADSFRDSTPYLQLVGGQFAEHPGGIKAFEVVVTDAASPITAGIERFGVDTEQYWVLTDAHNTVLAQTTHAATSDGVAEPWAQPVTVPSVWTRTWGEGRVFVSTVGHKLDDFDVAEVRTITERGLLWASR